MHVLNIDMLVATAMNTQREANHWFGSTTETCASTPKQKLIIDIQMQTALSSGYGLWINRPVPPRNTTRQAIVPLPGNGLHQGVFHCLTSFEAHDSNFRRVSQLLIH